MTATRRILRLAGLALAAALTAACAGDATLAAGNYVPGTPQPYALSTINGQPLPMEMRNTSSGRTLVTQGDLSLGGGTFSQRIVLTDVSPAGVATTRESVTEGTITATSDGHVHFRSSAGTEWDGNLQDGSLIYSFAGNNGPMTFVFLRVAPTQ